MSYKEKALEQVMMECKGEQFTTPKPHHWLRGIVEGTQDNQWMIKHTSLGYELVYMRNFGKKSFKNNYMVIRDDEMFYKQYCETIGL